MIASKPSAIVVLGVFLAAASAGFSTSCSNDSGNLTQNQGGDDEDDSEEDGGDERDTGIEGDVTATDGASSDTAPTSDAADSDGFEPTDGSSSRGDGTSQRDSDLDEDAIVTPDVDDDPWPNRDTEGGSGTCWPDAGSMDNPSCSEPSSCPAPDETQDPEVTCYSPHWTPVGEVATLDIYGRHLVKQGAPPSHVAYRDVETSGTSGRTNGDVTVVSDCHVQVELYLDDPFLQCGQTMEFMLVRDEGAAPGTDAGQQPAVASEWHEFRLTE